MKDAHDAHLTPEDLRVILSGEDELAMNRALLHVLATCPVCRAAGGDVVDFYEHGEIGLDLCSIEIDFARLRWSAGALGTELSRYPFEKQKALVRDTPRFKSWGLAEFLCRKSEMEASRDPHEAVKLAEVAVEVAFAIQEWEPAEQHWLDELRAFTWAILSNARRALGDLPSAEAAFVSAEQLWKPAMADVGDVLGYEARFLALKASLRRAQRRLPEALKLLDEALAAEPRPELYLRILINQAKTYEELGKIDEALAVLQKALASEIDDSDHRVRLCLAQNHLDLLSKADRFVEAEAISLGVETLAARYGSEIDRLRLRWTKGRIARGLGRMNEAVALLDGAGRELARLGLMYDAALSSLELALLYAELVRTDDVILTLQEAVPILSALKVHREGLMAVRVLTQSMTDGKVTAELLAQVVESLRRDKELPES